MTTLTGVVVAPAYGSRSGHAKQSAENDVDNHHPGIATFPRGSAVGCRYRLKVTGSQYHVRKTSATC